METQRPAPPSDLGDPLEADAIRRQVEYYFSDKNLAKDVHLLHLCGGTQNRGVSIDRIASWPKMRRYKPVSSVVAALRNSKMLVVEGRLVRRRQPLTRSIVQGDCEGSQVCESPARAAKHASAPTGFEFGYCDPPVTPQDFTKERGYYDLDMPVSHRLETAIQRYRGRRKFHQKTALIFNSFLEFGGVGCQQRQFGGAFAQDELFDLDADEIAHVKAIDSINTDRNEILQWTVDFEGIAKAYLAEHFPTLIRRSCHAEDWELVARLLYNFYGYLMHHDVCPEYAPDIAAARAVCERAKYEMPRLDVLKVALPGTFNITCRALLELQPYDQPVHQTRCTRNEVPSEGSENALAVVGMGLLAHAEQPCLERLLGTDHNPASPGERPFDWVCKLCRSDVALDGGFEIVRIERTTRETLQLYARAKQSCYSREGLKPLGMLVCRSWNMPDDLNNDLPPSGLMVSKGLTQHDPAAEVKLLLEDHLLELCQVGMRIVGSLRYLAVRGSISVASGDDSGFWYLHTVSVLYPTFYVHLLNSIEIKDTVIKWLPDEEGRDGNDISCKEGKAGEDDDDGDEASWQW